MATTVLYRISSGEVVKISIKGQPFTDRNTTYWGVLIDPNLPDGNETRGPRIGGALGALRVLGTAKIAIPGTNTVRNATQPEIDTFIPAEGEDDNKLDADQTRVLLKNHPQFRKFTQLMFKAMNKVREDAGLTKWTNPQIQAFIDSNVSKDD